MKNKIITFMIITSLSVSALAIITNLTKTKDSSKVLASEIAEAYTNMEEVIEQQMNNHEAAFLSSNPYDYIADNEYYDAIVNKGMEVVPILEEKLKNNEYNHGLLAYITAIAIEDITSCNLKAETETTWETSAEFISKWDTFVEDARNDIDIIKKKESMTEEDVKTLKKYGKLAAPLLKNAEERFDLDSRTKKQAHDFLSELGEQKFDDKELKNIEDYLKYDH